MSDTTPNITIPERTWVDLYAASGISVGTQLVVKLLGGYEVRLVTAATEPSDMSAFDVLVSRTVPVTNDSGASGAWAWSFGGALINVEAAE